MLRGGRLSTKEQSNADRYLPARFLQIVGLVLLIGFAIFWGVTGRESALLMSAAMSLILLGAYRGAIEALKNRVPSSPPPQDSLTGEKD